MRNTESSFSPVGDDAAAPVAVDAIGDVIAAGRLTPTAISTAAARAVKLSGATGRELWTDHPPPQGSRKQS